MGSRKTPLYELHRELGAKIVDFAGYSMPLQYADGILKEHRQTRESAGLFDISHMGQLRLSGAQADEFLESLVPGDIRGLNPAEQRYTVFTDSNGGILDDLMVTRTGDGLFLVVNAATRHADAQHLRRHLRPGVELEVLEDKALLAVQGPQSASIIKRLGDIGDPGFLHAVSTRLDGIECLLHRCGYSGEDGFEISVSAAEVETLARTLLDQPGIAPVGLGARDSLRLEAGLCLYGHDIDRQTTPVEAGLGWVVAQSRRQPASDAVGFPGQQRILEQLRDGCETRRVGLFADGRAPVREGTELMTPQGETVGQVTSGGFSPTLERPIAMGRVNRECAGPGTELQAIVRDRRRHLLVTALPFVKHRTV